jgi:hypothetical protein
MFPWAWAILKILNSPNVTTTARLAAKMPIIDITLKDVFLHDTECHNQNNNHNLHLITATIIIQCSYLSMIHICNIDTC